MSCSNAARDDFADRTSPIIRAEMIIRCVRIGSLYRYDKLCQGLILFDFHAVIGREIKGQGYKHRMAACLCECALRMTLVHFVDKKTILADNVYMIVEQYEN